ncbi:MAG: hypothetical protein WEA34_02835 [Gemmatimonadota bacterium]
MAHSAFIGAAVVSLLLVQGLASTEASAQEPVGASSGAEAAEPTTGSEWQLGIEIGDDPAGLLRWESHQAGWTFGAGSTAGPGAGDIQLRIAPHVRLQRTLVPRVLVGAGLGIEWTRLAREGNDEESELQWDVGLGWRPAKRLLAEAGVRWTDYRTRRTSAYLRIAVPLRMRGSRGTPEPPGPTPPGSVPANAPNRTSGIDPGPTPDPTPAPGSRLEAAAPIHATLPQLGVPPTSTDDGRLALPVEPVERGGSGIVLVASNPRGDSDPRSEAVGSNVDRLGLGAETWTSAGAWTGWARWRSDLHTDPSIAERTRAATEGLFFPVSISFSGGVRRSAGDGRVLGVSARHDPQALLWLPHLSQERTARVGSIRADGALGPAAVRVADTRLEPIEGQSVDALHHVRVAIDVAARNAFRVGLEHERLDTPGRGELRTRALVERSGRLSGRLLAGDDVALCLGAATELGAWRADAWASYRSEPELLHYDALVARGWMPPTSSGTPTPPGATPTEGDVFGYGLSAVRGPIGIALSGTLGDPVWTPGSIERAAGGTVDLVWTDRLESDRIEGRLAVRVAEWGPDRAWWREHPTAEAWIETGAPLGPALLTARLAARTELRSLRASLQHPAGAQVGLGLVGPLPGIGSLRGMTVSMRLDDLFDTGLPVRVGAPERGRRLKLSLAWMSRSGVDR